MYATLAESDALSHARALANHRSTAGPGDATLEALEHQVCAEAGIWAPTSARRALGQTGGDLPRAVALVRVWAAALAQVNTAPVEPADVHLTRRLSAAYPEVPGGQWLGSAPELASRLLDFDSPGGTLPTAGEPLPNGNGNENTATAPTPTRAACPRVRDLIEGVAIMAVPDDGDGDDPAGTTLAPPLSRATRLGVMARGETASLVTLASLVLNRRREAVLAEVTAAEVGVRVAHPRTGNPCLVAEVPIVEAEAVIDAEVDGRPGFAIGWGASLGSTERRAIALALIDGALQADRSGAAHASVELDPATVLAAVDGSATNGFVDHLRLPHYASFASYVDQARRSP